VSRAETYGNVLVCAGVQKFKNLNIGFPSGQEVCRTHTPKTLWI